MTQFNISADNFIHDCNKGGCVSPPLTHKQNQIQPFPCQAHTDSVGYSPISALAFHHDYLQGFFELSTVVPLLGFLKSFFGKFAVERKTYTQHDHIYTHVARTTNYVTVRYYYSEEKQSYIAWIQISGKPMSTLDIRDQLRLFYGLKHIYKFRCTRIDLALDDYKKSVSIAWMQRAIFKNQMSGYRITKNHTDTNSSDITKGITFGGKKSNKKLIIYETSATHPDIDAIRFELRYKEKFSQEYFDILTSHNAPWYNDQFSSHQQIEQMYYNCIDWACSLIIGSVNFIKRKDKNLGRATVIQWWGRFCKLVGDAKKLSVIREKTTIEKSINWLYRQVAVRLSVISNVFDDTFDILLQDIIEDGKKRQRKIDKILIQEATQSYSIP